MSLAAYARRAIAALKARGAHRCLLAFMPHGGLVVAELGAASPPGAVALAALAPAAGGGRAALVALDDPARVLVVDVAGDVPCFAIHPTPRTLFDAQQQTQVSAHRGKNRGGSDLP